MHELPIKDGHVYISDRLRVPLAPMIGCIGLAPAEGRSSSMAPTFPWGGNMDLRELSPGIYVLPGSDVVHSANVRASMHIFFCAHGVGGNDDIDIQPFPSALSLSSNF